MPLGRRSSPSRVGSPFLGLEIRLRGIGQLLIGLRIAQGLNQRQLAERLGVHESQVSRDERNEYFNITLERASRVLDALDAEVVSIVKSTGLDSASS